MNEVFSNPDVHKDVTETVTYCLQEIYVECWNHIEHDIHGICLKVLPTKAFIFTAVPQTANVDRQELTPDERNPCYWLRQLNPDLPDVCLQGCSLHAQHLPHPCLLG